MNFMMKLLALAIGLLTFITVASAQSPREQFQQMVEQLQKNPGDTALREKIIKLAQEIKPAPAVPDAAVEYEGRAQFAFNNAKSNADLLAAAREYEKAVANAPWVSGYYTDLCTIYEKANKFENAKRNCEFSLIGVTDTAQITDIKRRIAGLKYGIEQNSPSAVAEREKNNIVTWIAGLDGAQWQNNVVEYGLCEDGYIEIHRGEIYRGSIRTRTNASCLGLKVGEGWYGLRARLDGRDFVFDSSAATYRGTISEDGEKITIKKSYKRSDLRDSTETYTRVKSPRWIMVNGK